MRPPITPTRPYIPTKPSPTILENKNISLSKFGDLGEVIKSLPEGINPSDVKCEYLYDQYDYNGGGTNLSYAKEVSNPRYQVELNKYHRAIKKYNIALEKYNEDYKVYEKEMIEYKKWADKRKLIDTKTQIIKLEKLLAKLEKKQRKR